MHLLTWLHVASGYNNAEGYWLVQSSWGPEYADNGRFRVAFGAAALDTEVSLQKLLAHQSTCMTILTHKYGESYSVSPLLSIGSATTSPSKHMYDSSFSYSVVWANLLGPLLFIGSDGNSAQCAAVSSASAG